MEVKLVELKPVELKLVVELRLVVALKPVVELKPVVALMGWAVMVLVMVRKKREERMVLDWRCMVVSGC